MTATRNVHPLGVRSAGIALGVMADALLADPRRRHPVALFGRLALALERVVYRPQRRRGVLFAATLVGSSAAVGALAERWSGRHPLLRAALIAAATWTALGGQSLARAGSVMAGALEDGDLTAAREQLGHLCAREAAGLGSDDLARATVESLAENTSDAVVAPLLWASVAGAPGVLAYRAANTLDAMVGYRSSRYLRFGWAAARLDDVLNLVPARLTGLLTVLTAPAVGGSMRCSWRILRRDGAAHPSPNAGRCEAAAAGALGVELGGSNTYDGQVEPRPTMGDGAVPTAVDVRRAVRLGRVVGATAALVAVAVPLIAAAVQDRTGRRR